MDGIKTKYERNLNQSFFILEVDKTVDKNDFAYKMLEKNKIEGLLRLEIEDRDGSTCFKYDITSLKSLSGMLELKKLNEDRLRNLITEIHKLMYVLPEYLLDEDWVMIDSDCIFVNPRDDALFFCCWKEEGICSRDCLRELLSKLLSYIDHDDHNAVVLGYQLYKVSQKEEFVYTDLLDVLNHFVSENPTENKERHSKVIADLGLERGQDRNAKADQKASNAWNRKADRSASSIWCTEVAGSTKETSNDRNMGREQNFGNDWNMKNDRDLQKGELLRGERNVSNGRVAKLDEDLIGKVMNGLDNSDCSLEETSSKQNTEEGKAAKAKPFRLRDIFWFKNKKKLETPEYLDDVIENDDEKQWMEYFSEYDESRHTEEVEHTTLLSERMKELETKELHILKSLNKSMKDIELSFFPFVIGKQERVCDYVMDASGISRIHLKIDHVDGKFFVQDLNSLNGTKLRGDSLLMDKEEEMFENDELDIAGYKFVFI